MNLVDKAKVNQRMGTRIAKNRAYKGLYLISTLFGLVILAVLLYRIFTQGIGWLDMDFFQNYASRRPARAGIKAALIGSLWMMAVVIPLSLIIGVGTALYLEEYAKKSRFNAFIQTNISNLAGVPSIVFGLLGLTVFVRFMDLGRSVLAAGLTMTLLVLPVIIVASQEAIRAVPKELREASYGMGATKWQTIKNIVLPASIPGILTGSILSISRGIGETAPLVVLGIPTFIATLPSGVLDTLTVMPMQIYNWTSRPQEDFQNVAAAGIIVLLGFLIILNLTAIIIRNKFQKRY